MLVLLFFLLSFNTCFAQTATSSSTQEVNYTLPYPGLLPDSPLYFFRVLRDGIVGFLISDPLKKSEFDLLQADKRLNAGIYLVNKGETSLAFSTVSKAENYFDQAITKLGEARAEGKDVTGMEGKLRDALKKHEQELKILAGKVNANLKTSFDQELKRITGFEQRLNQ